MEPSALHSPKMMIHPTAVVHPTARLGADVTIGPFCIVEEDTEIGDGSTLESHVVVKQGTRLGKNCLLCPGVVLGHVPQDSKFKGERSFLIIGDNNVFREYATLHRSTAPAPDAPPQDDEEALYAHTSLAQRLRDVPGPKTIVGDDNLFMAYAHVGHNCRIGSRVIVSPYVGISGHVVVEDGAVLGGMAGLHQFVRVGTMAMVGGYSKVVQDVPPFMMADGRPAKVVGLNLRGLVRNGVRTEVRESLKQSYKILYRSDLNIAQAVERIQREVTAYPEIEYLLQFLRRIREGRMGRQEERPAH
ncbi:MAG: UDP-N-acetylglucosamine O-acyltransferase [Abditibacteriales bacterium]|nr:UDP-N-acetylglucosamine O-acyltransferase [Abditibacteriales bacterium]MDW8367490.1 UDP-N-acetylglucosamine O-acyltransferase [Abditibacteriales bacterium]